MKKTAEEIRERIVQAHIESINWDEGNFDLLRKNIDEGLEEYRSQASELPSEEQCDEIAFKKLLLTGRTESEEIQDRKLIVNGLTIMRSIASPLLASKDARIKELEDKIRTINALAMAKNLEAIYQESSNLTPKP